MKPKGKKAGGRKSEQHPYHPHPTPSSVQSAVECAHQELVSTATSERARIDHQPFQQSSSARKEPSSAKVRMQLYLNISQPHKDEHGLACMKSVGSQSIKKSVGSQSILKSVGSQSILKSVGSQSILKSVGSQSISACSAAYMGQRADPLDLYGKEQDVPTLHESPSYG